MTITVIRRRDTTRSEQERLKKQGELVVAHNKGLLGRHWYSEGKDKKPYLSPVQLRKKL